MLNVAPIADAAIQAQTILDWHIWAVGVGRGRVDPLVLIEARNAASSAVKVALRISLRHAKKA